MTRDLRTVGRARAPESPAARPWTATERERWDHDLRNLVYLVVSLARLLRSGQPGPLTETQEEMLGHIVDCAEQIRTLVDEAAGRGGLAPGDGATPQSAAGGEPP